MKPKFDRRPGTPKPKSVTTRAGEILARAAAKLFTRKQSGPNISDDRKRRAAGGTRSTEELRQRDATMGPATVSRGKGAGEKTNPSHEIKGRKF